VEYVLLGGLVVVALLVVGAVLAHRADRARREALAAMARRWGLRFVPEADHRPERRFPGVAWFRQGDDQWLSNTMAGPMELSGRTVIACAGDFTYEEHRRDSDGNRHTSTYHRSYFTVDLGLSTPDLAVRPEGFTDKVKAMFGFADIEFESAEFNRRFHVKCSDKKFAFDVFHARAQEWLMASSWRAFELCGGLLLVAGDEFWEPERFAAARAFAEEVLRQWPDFVWDDLSARTHERA